MVLVWRIVDDSSNLPNFPSIWYDKTKIHQHAPYHTKHKMTAPPILLLKHACTRTSTHTHPPTHQPTDSPTHRLTNPPTDPPTQPSTHGPTDPSIHPPTDACARARAHTHTHTHTHTHLNTSTLPTEKPWNFTSWLSIPCGYQLIHFRLIQWNMSLHVQVVTLETINHMWLDEFTRWCIIPDKCCLKNDFIDNTYKKTLASHMMPITWSNTPGTDMAGTKQWFVPRLLSVGMASWCGN